MSKLRINELESLETGRSLKVDEMAQAFDYEAGIKITSYSQMVRDDNGEFWMVSGQVDLPYVTTGSGLPEDGALVLAGDSVLRQELADPDKGAALVGYGDGTVADKLDEIVSGAVTEPIVDAKVVEHNHDPAAHPELSAFIFGEIVRKTDFVETGLNLFNPDSVTVGKVILASGSIVDHHDYSTTGFIDVEPGETYSKVGVGTVFTYVTQYDSGGNFLTRTDFLGPVTLTEDTTMVRLSFQGPVSANRMFYKGSDPVEYEPYKVVIKRLEVPENRPDDIFMSDVPLEGIFSGIDYSSVWPEYAANITAAAVYQKYDELMAEFPEYISKQVLGEDDFGYTISAYHLSPDWPRSSFNDLKRPKIFITAGTHGNESIPPLACYLTFRDMLERWQEDPLLEALKYNADYIIIPVVNPSGWDDYTRQNRNGVDINRNFPDGWTLGAPGSGTYGGPEPFSEPESRLIKKVFDENPDIAVCYDFHNFSGTSNTTDFIWVPTGQGRRVQHMASNLITSLTRKWRKEYDWFPPEPYFAGYTNGTSDAMVQDYAKGLGIKYSATFEVCGRWHIDPSGVPFDGTHRTTMVEAWANWLLINMRALVSDL